MSSPAPWITTESSPLGAGAAKRCDLPGIVGEIGLQRRIIIGVAKDRAGGFVPASLSFASIGDQETPALFKNVRIATGGGMNLIEKLTRDGKLVSHGILFDVNQATLKPQSMGAMGEIGKLLKENPALKLEIAGHTDADGDAARNLALSQARVDAVKQVLVEAGIDAARLTTKGYGATKPIEPNTTPEGKANNRRVEFTKVGQ